MKQLIGWMALLVLATGCGKKMTSSYPPPPVTVATPRVMDSVIYYPVAGRIEASQTVRLEALVRGELREVLFTDGQRVEAGQDLFRIEPERYEAALKSAQAQLARARATAQLSETAYQRKQEAFKSRAVSELDLLAAEADRTSTAAAVQAAEATVTQAELDLAHCTIQAPVAGRISRSLLSVGNQVGNSLPATLATLVVDEPIAVYFAMDERMMLSWLARRAAGESVSNANLRVYLETADDVRLSEPAVIDYVDPNFDPATGTVQVRAMYANADRRILPGMFVRVQIPDERPQALRVPDLAVQRDMAGAYVMTVNATNGVEQQYVQAGPRVEADRIIEQGLEPTARVIVKGLQSARPGMVVTVTDPTRMMPPAGAK